MANIKPTRMELLKLKHKLKLAKKGHKLLKQKNDVLILEFFETLKSIKKLREELGGKLSRAQNSLIHAIAIEGEQNIERISSSLSSDTCLEISKRSIMDVEFPEIKDIKVKHNGYGYYGYTIELDNAVLLYRELLKPLLKLSEKQLMLNYLAQEIKKTKRRVNSLECLIIPSMECTKKLIMFKLEEIERESFIRLKKIKEFLNKEDETSA
ncbi:V-type ATP synthase subunit D [Candidatus Woesearchaeota archaeon]|nr:V-type ATP synthase subunit D [Candidatus Woesearchaeota archaeon]